MCLWRKSSGALSRIYLLIFVNGLRMQALGSKEISCMSSYKCLLFLSDLNGRCNTWTECSYSVQT
jgi:hypothetical protein